MDDPTAGWGDPDGPTHFANLRTLADVPGCVSSPCAMPDVSPNYSPEFVPTRRPPLLIDRTPGPPGAPPTVGAWVGCVGQCISQNGVGAGALIATGALSAFPKRLVPPFRVPLGMGRANPLTTLPSIATQLGAPTAVRNFGRLVSPLATPAFVVGTTVDVFVGLNCGAMCYWH